MIYVDIDQVVRNLLEPMGIDRTRFYAVKSGGKTLVEFYDISPELLETAPATEYCKVISAYFKEFKKTPIFITSCRDSWLPHTTKWLDKHFHQGWRCKWVKEPEEKIELVGRVITSSRTIRHSRRNFTSGLFLSGEGTTK